MVLFIFFIPVFTGWVLLYFLTHLCSFMFIFIEHILCAENIQEIKYITQNKKVNLSLHGTHVLARQTENEKINGLKYL